MTGGKVPTSTSLYTTLELRFDAHHRLGSICMGALLLILCRNDADRSCCEVVLFGTARDSAPARSSRGIDGELDNCSKGIWTLKFALPML